MAEKINVEAQEKVVFALYRFAEAQRTPGPNAPLFTAEHNWDRWLSGEAEVPDVRKIDPPLVIDANGVRSAMESIMAAFGYTVAEIQ